MVNQVGIFTRVLAFVVFGLVGLNSFMPVVCAMESDGITTASPIPHSSRHGSPVPGGSSLAPLGYGFPGQLWPLHSVPSNPWYSRGHGFELHDACLDADKTDFDRLAHEDQDGRREFGKLAHRYDHHGFLPLHCIIHGAYKDQHQADHEKVYVRAHMLGKLLAWFPYMVMYPDVQGKTLFHHLISLQSPCRDQKFRDAFLPIVCNAYDRMCGGHASQSLLAHYYQQGLREQYVAQRNDDGITGQMLIDASEALNKSKKAAEKASGEVWEMLKGAREELKKQRACVREVVPISIPEKEEVGVQAVPQGSSSGVQTDSKKQEARASQANVGFLGQEAGVQVNSDVQVKSKDTQTIPQKTQAKECQVTVGQEEVEALQQQLKTEQEQRGIVQKAYEQLLQWRDAYVGLPHEEKVEREGIATEQQIMKSKLHSCIALVSLAESRRKEMLDAFSNTCSEIEARRYDSEKHAIQAFAGEVVSNAIDQVSDTTTKKAKIIECLTIQRAWNQLFEEMKTSSSGFEEIFTADSAKKAEVLKVLKMHHPKDGATFLHYCVKQASDCVHNNEDKQMQFVEAIIAAACFLQFCSPEEKESIINARSDSDNTPLHYAAMMENTRALLVLLKIGAKPDVQNNDGNTPLHCAIVAKHLSNCEVLFKACPACMGIKNSLGFYPVHLAAQGVAFKILEYIYNNVGGILEKDEAAVTLGERRAVFEQQDANGMRPLHWVASVGSIGVVHWLINAVGVEKDMQDKNGKTPLEYAVAEMNPETVAEFLFNGVFLEKNVIKPSIDALIRGKAPKCIDIIQTLIDSAYIAREQNEQAPILAVFAQDDVFARAMVTLAHFHQMMPHEIEGHRCRFHIAAEKLSPLQMAAFRGSHEIFCFLVENCKAYYEKNPSKKPDGWVDVTTYLHQDRRVLQYLFDGIKKVGSDLGENFYTPWLNNAVKIIQWLCEKGYMPEEHKHAGIRCCDGIIQGLNKELSNFSGSHATSSRREKQDLTEKQRATMGLRNAQLSCAQRIQMCLKSALKQPDGSPKAPSPKTKKKQKK